MAMILIMMQVQPALFMSTKLLKLITLSILMSLCSVVQAAVPFLKWDERIVHGKLDNGFQYFLYNSESSSDPFNIRLIVHAGSIDEPEVKGIAHAVEHMVFNQTAEHPEGVHDYLAQIGWRTGKQINAKTRATETQYMIRTRPNDVLGIKESLALLKDMVGSAQLSQSDWLREKKIIAEEKRVTDHVVSRLSQQIKRSTMANSKYSQGPVIGSFLSIQNISIDEIRQFYHHNYVASNMTMIITGHFDTEKTKHFLESTFGQLPYAKMPDRAFVNYPIDNQIKLNKVQDPQGSSSKVALGFRVAIANKNSQEGIRVRLENYLIRKILTKQILRNSEYLSDEVNTLTGVIKTPANERLTLAFGARTENHDAGLQSILLEIERLKKFGLDKHAFAVQVEKAKQISARNVEMAEQRTFSQWEDKISNALFTGGVVASPQDVHTINSKLLKEITLVQLNQRLNDILNSPDIFIYYQAPSSVALQLPSVDLIKQWRKNAQSAEVLPPVPYLQTSESQTLDNKEQSEAQDIILQHPEPSSLPTADRVFKEQSVYQWQMDNGNKIVWLNKPTDDKKIYLKSVTNIGSQSKQYPEWLTQSAIQIFEQTPPANIDQVDWQNWISDHGSDWKFKLQDHHLDISAVVDAHHLEDALLAFWYHHQPRSFSDDAVEVVKQSAKELLERDKPDSLERFRYGDDIIDIPTHQQLESLNAEQLSQTANSLVQQPHTLFIVGSLDQQQLRELGGQYLSTIENAELLDSQPKIQRAGQHQFTRYRVGHNQAQVTIYGRTPVSWTPETAFKLSTLNPIAQQALRKKLRLELAGVYRVGFELSLDSDTNQAEYELSFTTQPDLAEKLSIAANNVLKNLPSSIEELNLARTKQDIKFAEQNRMQSPTTWLNRLMLSYRAYGDPRYLDSMLTIGEQLNKADLIKLSQQIFSAPNTVQINTLMKKEAVNPASQQK